LAIVTTYNTLESLSEGLFKEKGSKFIAYAVACYSEEEAKNILEGWRKKHPQSRHLCYAYRLGAEGNVFRMNDDGEPTNSAGAPILGQLQSYQLTNALIGVVRYFGGVKLGVGGLVSAYRSAAKEAIENGSIITQEIVEWLELSFRYEQMPQIMNFIKKQALVITAQQFEEDCSLSLRVPLALVDFITNELTRFEGLTVTTKGIF
jgi:uncharacterized YigZ family protein